MIRKNQKWSLLLHVMFLFVNTWMYAQNTDSSIHLYNLKTVVSVTNNGVSLIPTFSLGKPAVIFDASIGRRLSFDPLVRFSMEGKPWAFIFWWRYKLLKPSNKFQMNIGAHPAILFKTLIDTSDGLSKEIISGRRYLVGELNPYFSLTNNLIIGLYYTYSRGIEKEDVRNTHFITARVGFYNIRMSKKILINLVPQFYYLKMDKRDGFYFTSSFTIAKNDFPLSISTIINKTIQSEIASKGLIWNVTLNYTFNKKYVEYSPET